MKIIYKFFLLYISVTISLTASELIEPIPLKMQVDKKKVSLGKALFFDTILSKDGSVSCASCHIIEEGGDDNSRVSTGIQGKKGEVNAPTVLNAVFNFTQFWDGRAKDLQEQVRGPIENPVEMGHHIGDVVNILKESSYYNKQFQKIYKEGVTIENIANAIAEFEKTLITPNAPFDRYLRGDENALSKKQKEGYELFKAKGCIACHQGINIGGNMFNKFGIYDTPTSAKQWMGRYNVTHRERDKHYFKVPSLRNIVHTAPYFHDGNISDLRSAVKLMAQIQLGRYLTEEEIDSIIAFLHSLSGEIPSY